MVLSSHIYLLRHSPSMSRCDLKYTVAHPFGHTRMRWIYALTRRNGIGPLALVSLPSLSYTTQLPVLQMVWFRVWTLTWMPMTSALWPLSVAHSSPLPDLIYIAHCSSIVNKQWCSQYGPVVTTASPMSHSPKVIAHPAYAVYVRVIGQDITMSRTYGNAFWVPQRYLR